MGLACDSPRMVLQLLIVSLCDTVNLVIKSFRHAGIEQFFRKGSKAGIQPKHAKRLRLQLAVLDSATGAPDMNLPGWRWHPLKGELDGLADTVLRRDGSLSVTEFARRLGVSRVALSRVVNGRAAVSAELAIPGVDEASEDPNRR